MKSIFNSSFLFAIIILLLTSCHTTKTNTSQSTKSSNDTIITKQNQKNSKKEDIDYTKLLNNNTNYQWYSTRMQAVIGTPEESQSVQLFIVNRKDSIIYVNISKFFIEVSRAVITTDSVKFMNKLDMTYYVGDYSIFYKKFGVNLNFNMIQSILTASDFNQFENNFNVINSDSTLIFNAENRLNKKNQIKINQSITYSKGLKQIVMNSIEDISSQQKAIISYSTFQTIDSIQFPQYWQIEIPGIRMKASFLNEGTRLNIEGPTSIRIPDRYKPISFGTNE